MEDHKVYLASPIAHVLNLQLLELFIYLKKFINKHIRSTNPTFLLHPTNIENIINTQRTNFPNITPQTTPKHLYKLLLHHITKLSQITPPTGTQLTDIQDFELQHTKSTKALKTSLDSLHYSLVMQHVQTNAKTHAIIIHHSAYYSHNSLPLLINHSSHKSTP